jgi:hypothetical protein
MRGYTGFSGYTHLESEAKPSIALSRTVINSERNQIKRVA